LNVGAAESAVGTLVLELHVRIGDAVVPDGQRVAGCDVANGVGVRDARGGRGVDVTGDVAFQLVVKLHSGDPRPVALQLLPGVVGSLVDCGVVTNLPGPLETAVDSLLGVRAEVLSGEGAPRGGEDCVRLIASVGPGVVHEGKPLPAKVTELLVEGDRVP